MVFSYQFPSIVPVVNTPPKETAAQKRAKEEKARTTARQAAAKRKKAEAAKKAKAEKARKAKEKAEKAKNKPAAEPDLNYKWNLPPHQWSLPVTPKTMYEDLYTGAKGYDVLEQKGIGLVPETYRRGRMWWYANTANQFELADGEKASMEAGDSRKIGFQFLWNPESFTTSISLNTETTPSVNDRFVGVAGAFPSGETISFSLRIDRTNDFLCARNLINKEYSRNTFSSSANNAAFSQLAKYYKTSFFEKGDDAEISKKIKDLMEVGTIADLEYIYTMINGKGPNGKNWKSINGRETGDIGFLSATLIRLDIGPLSYIGYVNSLTVNHLAFSQDMTPMRTDVSIALNLMASAGIPNNEEDK